MYVSVKREKEKNKKNKTKSSMNIYSKKKIEMKKQQVFKFRKLLKKHHLI